MPTLENLATVKPSPEFLKFVEEMQNLTASSLGIPIELIEPVKRPQIAAPPQPVNVHSTYLHKLFSHPENLRAMIEQAVSDLKPHASSFDSIAFRGMSGAIAAPPIALALGKHLTAARKDGEDSHADFKVEGLRDCRYIIVDDLIASGRTVLQIQRQIAVHSPRAYCVGIYLYNTPAFYSRAEFGDAFYFDKP